MHVRIESYSDGYVKFISQHSPSENILKPLRDAGYRIVGEPGEEIYPVLNQQIDGFPKTIEGQYYGIYFEVPFENGALFVITRMSINGPIEVEYFQDFNNEPNSSNKCTKANWAGVKELLWCEKNELDVIGLMEL